MIGSILYLYEQMEYIFEISEDVDVVIRNRRNMVWKRFTDSEGDEYLEASKEVKGLGYSSWFYPQGEAIVQDDILLFYDEFAEEILLLDSTKEIK